MSAAARTVARDISRQTDALSGSVANTLALKAASEGLGDKYAPVIASLQNLERSSAAAKKESVALFGASEAAATAYYSKLDALVAKSSAEMAQVRAAQKRFESEVRGRSDANGEVSPVDKQLLAASKAASNERIQQLKFEYIEQAALIKQQAVATAQAETSANAQVAAARKVVDAQNGLTATYRTQLAALRDLRDAGNLSPAQFKAASSSLALQQPAAKALAEQRAAAAQVVAEQKKAADAAVESAQRIIDANNGVSASYRKQLDEILALRRARLLSKDDARTAVGGLNAQQPAERAKQAFLSNLNNLAAGFNDDGTQKARSALLALQAAQLGVGKEAEAALKKLTLLDEKTGQFGKSAFGARNRLLTLQYTISDVIASAGSGISPLTILLQQGGQVFDAFGGANAQGKGGFFKNFFGTLGQIITPARLAIAGVTGAVAGLAVAWYEGRKQSKDFADAIVLTGNFAGITEGRYNLLAKSIAASGQVTIGAAREYTQALIATGEIGPEVLAKAAQAAAAYGKASGKSAKEVADEFAAMNKDVSAGAERLNRTMHILTAAQLEQIRALQEQGRSAEAQGIVFDALNTRLPKLEANLGLLEKAWRGAGKAASSFWDAALDIGRSETPEDRIAAIDKQLRALADRRVAGVKSGEGFQPRIATSRDDVNSKSEADLLVERANQQRVAITAQYAAAAQANDAVAEQATDSALKYYRAQAKEAKLGIALTRELAEEEKAYQAIVNRNARARTDGEKVPVPTDAERAAIQKKIRDSYKEKGGRKDNEPEQVRQQQLAADLKLLQEAFQNERETIAFHNRETAALYQAGTVSLKDFYAARVQEIDAGSKREIDAQLKTIARLKKELDNPLVQANPSERVKIEGQIAEAVEKTTQVAVAGSRARRLAQIEEINGYKQLADQVNNFRAGLLQLQGNESGSAELRIKAQLVAARELAVRSQNAPDPGDRISENNLRQYEAALKAQAAVNEAKRETDLINQGLAISEERIALMQKTGAITELEAMQAQAEARRSVVAGLEAQLAAMQKVYDESAKKDPQLILNIERTRLELDKLKASLDPLKEKFDNLFKDAGASFFEDLAGGKGLKAALKNFGSTISNEITRTISKQWSETLFGPKGVFGGAGGGLADVFGVGRKTSQDPETAKAKAVLEQTAAIGQNTQATTQQTEAAQIAAEAITTASQSSVQALLSLKDAAEAAAQAVSNLPGGGAQSFPVPNTGSTGIDVPFQTDGNYSISGGEASVFKLFGEADKAQAASAKTTEKFSKTTEQAGMDLLRMAASAQRGGSALSALPGLLDKLANLGSSSSSGGVGGLFGSIGKLFSGSTSFAGLGGGAGNYNFGGGFDSGGYTGDAPASAPAGVVHGQEFVFSAPAVRTLGVPTLDRLHRQARGGTAPSGRSGYADGGWVRPRGGDGGMNVHVPVTLVVQGSVDSRTPGQIGAEIGRHVRRELARGTA
mgnify:CR=1 FL=1